MAPKYGVGKRVVGVRGTNQGLHGIISNRVQVSGSWWLDITWDNGQVTRSRTGDVDLEGGGAPNNVHVLPIAANLGNAVGVVDGYGSGEDNSQESDSSEESDREAIGDLDG